MVKQMMLKQRSRNRIDVILTGLMPDTAAKDYPNIVAWPIAARVYIACPEGMVDHDGIRFFPCKGDVPTFREVMSSFIQLPSGNGFVGICNSGIQLCADAEPLFQHVDDLRMTHAWASHSGGDIPELFVMSGSMVLHFIREIPFEMPFGGAEWRIWLHNWMKTYMQLHRYFDANAFNLVITTIPEPVKVEIPPEPIIEKKRPGRPKKK